MRVNAQTLEERERGMRVLAEREREEARVALEGERGIRVLAEREREEARVALEGERGIRVLAEREREEARVALEGERGMRVSAEREREEARVALEGERGMRVSAEREREEARVALEGERGMRVSAEREREEARVALEGERGMRVSAEREQEEARVALEGEREIERERAMRVALERGEARVALERERGMRVSAEREREEARVALEGERGMRVSAEREREEARAALEHEREDIALLHQALSKEKTTVFKPLLRRVYRLGVAVTLRMPSPIRRRLIRLKRSLWPTPASLNMESGHTGSNTGRGPALDTVDEVELGQPASGCSDVLVFPVIDWDFRFQRSQQLSKQFAERGHRVFYLSASFKAADEPGFQFLRSPIPNVFLVQLCFPGKQPVIYQDRLEDETIEKFVGALNKLYSLADITNTIGMIALPFWGRLAEALPGCMMIYDCMDYHAGFSTNADQMIEEESRLLKRADLVITTSVELSRTVGLSTSNTLIRNAGEIEYFGKIPVQLAYTTERPVVGYLGAIADWFDIDLVVAAARQYPEWDFVLVGSTAYCDISEAEALDNVKLIGEVPYTEAAGWVHSFDVALIPFKLNKLTLCTNPVKMYEYLAAGKPVVSTDLPEVRLVRDMVHVAESRERFIELLAVAMTECNDRQRAARRIEWAGKHDWAARYEQLENAIRGALPKVSVIVLTYNNLALTKACLESLERNTHYPNWELILIDNASTDGTQEFLANYAAHNPHARLIQNESNRGFSASNNQGLLAAGGEYFVILNNDTYVTEGWIAGLIRHFRQNPNLGLIGPVTNMIGNEAKIDIDYTNMTEMQGAAWEYTSRHPGVELESAVLAFFCVGMPRRIHEIVGDLDERFGLGGFEDDDYCNRVRKAGFEIAIAEDVFIHHELSATSKLIDQKERQELFERNKAYYEQKWGPWIPHRYRDQNPEARDVDKS